MKKYFTEKSDLIKFLVEELGMDEDDAEDLDLVDKEEERVKRSTAVSGWLHDHKKDVYYDIYFSWNYDWGPSDFHIDTTPMKREEYEETVVVKKVRYTEAEC